MIQDINLHITEINRSIAWANEYNKKTFPIEELKDYRRKLKKISNALDENCSAAAYGESQVGKSYLISSLLSSAESPFVITNNGKKYSFIDDLNPSGGNTSKTESTGIITRFTINNSNDKMKDFIKIRNLSVADILMLLIDSYYNDLKIDNKNILLYDAINKELSALQYIWANKNEVEQEVFTEDDIKDIFDYISEILGSNAVNITHSNFCNIVAPNIQHISSENWASIFSLLWNKNEELTRLFKFLIDEYKKIGFETDIYVPFDAVLRDKGTLLKIEWLDSVCGLEHKDEKDVLVTDIYNSKGELLAKDFKKSSLSAIIAELTFVLPKEIAKDRKFLNKIDLLDFPGARSREKIEENEIGKVLPTILRRGKVAYLFNKYSRSLRISSVLFCHHNDQKNEATLGNTINDWISQNIGKNPEARTNYLKLTEKISPLFLIATKFNIELEITKNDTPDNKESLSEHWKRFKTVLPEIIKPSKWFDNWVMKGEFFNSEVFQGIYLLRDFYWSSRNQVFDGYREGISPEIKIHEYENYPSYFSDLEESFLANDFVKKHFANPKESWDNVASLNSDGSKAIIRDLDKISNVLDAARKETYLEKLRIIQKEILSKLNTYYEPENKEENNARVRTIVGEIRIYLDSQIGKRPEIFGYIIDNLMIPTKDLRNIAYDIVVLKTETPKDFNEIILIRNQAGINTNENKDLNIKRLCDYYACDVDTLEEHFSKDGFTIDDVVSNECNIATTVGDLVAISILEYWTMFINKQVESLGKYLPHSNEVAFMLQSLCQKLGVQKVISDKISQYSNIFTVDDLPNAIADFASLTLNNFVSSIGRMYMTDEDIKNIGDKATACNLIIDLSSECSNIRSSEISVVDALKAFDDATDPTTVPIRTLMKLPFWDNFQRWKNLLVIGLLYSSDISHTDPKANAIIKNIIDNCTGLYK